MIETHPSHLRMEGQGAASILTPNRSGSLSRLPAVLIGGVLRAFNGTGAQPDVRSAVSAEAAPAFGAGRDLRNAAMGSDGLPPRDVGAAAESNNRRLALRLLWISDLAAVNAVANGAGASTALTRDETAAQRSAAINQAASVIRQSLGSGGHSPFERLRRLKERRPDFRAFKQAQAPIVDSSGDPASTACAVLWVQVAGEFALRVQRLRTAPMASPKGTLLALAAARHLAGVKLFEPVAVARSLLMRTVGDIVDEGAARLAWIAVGRADRKGAMRLGMAYRAQAADRRTDARRNCGLPRVAALARSRRRCAAPHCARAL